MIISPEDFNRLIPHIHDQEEISVSVLNGLASIYRTHRVHNKYGCQLLHRHYDMPDKSIALTTEIGESISVTKVTPLGNVDLRSIRGQLYLLNEEGRFQAYEYEYGLPLSFPDAFLKKLASFIQQNGLRDKIAITSSIDDKPRTETQLGSEATVTFSPKTPKVMSEQRSINTSLKRTVFDFRDEPVVPATTCIGAYWDSRCIGYYHPVERDTGRKLDADYKQSYGEGGDEKSGAEAYETPSDNGLSGKFSTSEPFNFDKYDVKGVLREAGLI